MARWFNSHLDAHHDVAPQSPPVSNHPILASAKPLLWPVPTLTAVASPPSPPPTRARLAAAGWLPLPASLVSLEGSVGVNYPLVHCPSGEQSAANPPGSASDIHPGTMRSHSPAAVYGSKQASMAWTPGLPTAGYTYRRRTVANGEPGGAPLPSCQAGYEMLPWRILGTVIRGI